MNVPDIRLSAPDSPAHWADVRALFLEYAQGLGRDLSFQGFDAELAALPGDYAPPRGAMVLARVGGALAACGAMRPKAVAGHAGACEMKRLYVRDAFRGFGLGRRIARRLIEHARAAGHAAMLLDTLPDMASAQGLYASLGFVEIAPYYANPIAGTRYMKLDLERW
jgi:putative acetyltransferase